MFRLLKTTAVAVDTNQKLIGYLQVIFLYSLNTMNFDRKYV